MKNEIVYLGDLQRVVYEPGDTLVLMHLGRLRGEQNEYLQRLMLSTFPGAKVLVLDSGTKIGVMSESEEGST